jgi:hypothetical protein
MRGRRPGPARSRCRCRAASRTRPGQAAGLDGRLDGAADQLRRAGVGRVGLDHHRAAGRQGRGGVAAGHREGQREVAAPNTATGRAARCAGAGRDAAAACGPAGPDRCGLPGSRRRAARWRTGAAGPWCGRARLRGARAAGRSRPWRGRSGRRRSPRCARRWFPGRWRAVGRGGAVGAERLGRQGAPPRLEVGLGRAAEGHVQRGAGAGIDREDRAAGPGAAPPSIRSSPVMVMARSSCRVRWSGLK